MTELNDAVCAVLETISPGQVATYGDVARQVGITPRLAGREVGRVPDDVPWWRVVRADGTPADCRGGTAAARLASEGVPIKNCRVDLARARNSGGAGVPSALPTPAEHQERGAR